MVLVEEGREGAQETSLSPKGAKELDGHFCGLLRVRVGQGGYG